MALTDTAGRSPHGTEGPRRQAPPGQATSAAKPTIAQQACASVSRSEIRFRAVSWGLLRDQWRGWGHLGVLLSLVYRLVRCLFGLLAVLVRSDLSKDAELLVLRHENQVLRRQLGGRLRWDHADRLWLTELSGLVSRRRWAEVFPITPASWRGWAMRSPRPRCGRSCTLRASIQRPGGPGRPGMSSWLPRLTRSSPVTSSWWRRCCSSGCTCWCSSGGAQGRGTADHHHLAEDATDERHLRARHRDAPPRAAGPDLIVSTAIGKSGWVVLFSPGWRPPVFQAGGRVFSRRAGVRSPAGSPPCLRGPRRAGASRPW